MLVVAAMVFLRESILHYLNEFVSTAKNNVIFPTSFLTQAPPRCLRLERSMMIAL